MKKLLLILFVISLNHLGAFAQNISFTGTIVDTSNIALPFSSIFLLEPTDSTLITFARADENGSFILKNVKNRAYLFKASFVGYLPVQFEVNGNKTELGKVVLKPISKELYEVVVKTARAPIQIRGDTIEYNASSFKVPPGSSVEELLRKIPGMQIDAEGNIKAQGRDVQKVLVDGKRFFGDDPKVATRSLPAESLDKIQVYDDKSEQTKLTGVEDGKLEKTVNLELKEEFKKGGFGKIKAGVGTDNRAMAQGNYNKFNAKNQFALIGFGNNLNQSGLNRDDYQDFKGSQSYNWGDNADFGIGGNSFSFTEDDEQLGVPRSWQPGVGFSKNYATGLNYNYDTKNTKLSSSYFFNQSSQILHSFNTSEIFLSSLSYNTNNENKTSNSLLNHRLSFRIEQNLDSNNTVVLNWNSRLGTKGNEINSSNKYNTPQNEEFRSQNTESESDSKATVVATSAIYRHKFKKKGRNFALSGTYNLNNGNANSYINSDIIQTTIPNWPIGLFPGNANQHQKIEGFVNSSQYKSSVLYSEPISKKISAEIFYNWSKSINAADRDVFNGELSSRPRIDSLSRYFENDIDNNRLGMALRYNFKGIIFNLGLARQFYELNGDFYRNQEADLLGKVHQKSKNWQPNAGLSLQLKNNRYIYMDYDLNIRQPSANELIPFVDNTNPLFIRLGNPNLLPSKSHQVWSGFYFFNAASFINFNIYSGYTYEINQIVYNQTVSENLISTIAPMNVSGGQSFRVGSNFGFPIVKTKLTLNLNANLNPSKNLVYINDILNTNQNFGIQYGTRIDITPNDKLTAFINFGSNSTKATYSEFASQNQKFTQQNLSVDITLQPIKLFFVNANLNYQSYQNKKLNFDQKVPILSFEAYKVLGKNKKGEIKISGYDLLKRNLGINQSAYQNTISNNRTLTLSRYIMLTYTYNMRGVGTKMKKNQWE